MTYIQVKQFEELNILDEFIDDNANQGTIEHLFGIFQLNKTCNFCCYNIRT